MYAYEYNNVTTTMIITPHPPHNTTHTYTHINPQRTHTFTYTHTHNTQHIRTERANSLNNRLSKGTHIFGGMLIK